MKLDEKNFILEKKMENIESNGIIKIKEEHINVLKTVHDKYSAHREAMELFAETCYKSQHEFWEIARKFYPKLENGSTFRLDTVNWQFIETKE